MSGGAQIVVVDGEPDLRDLVREYLLRQGYAGAEGPFDRSVDFRIVRLRRKFELDPRAPQVVKTVRGAGCVFVPAGG